MADRNLSVTADLSALIKSALEGGQAIGNLQKQMEASGITAKEWGAALDKAAPQLKVVADSSKSAGDALGSYIPKANDQVVASFAKVKDAIPGAISPFKDQLPAAAKEGAAGLSTLEQAVTSLVSRFVPGMSQITGSLKDVGKLAKGAGEEGSSGLSSLGAGAAKAAPEILAVAAAAVVLGKGISESIAAFDGAVKGVVLLKTEFGLSAKEASNWQNTLKAAGMEGDNLNKHVNLLSKAVEAAQAGQEKHTKAVLEYGAGSKEAAAATDKSSEMFAKLGVSITDSSGHLKNMKDLDVEVLKSFANMTDGAEKNRIGTELMGRGWQNLIPFLNKVRDGTVDLGKAQSDGVQITDADIKKSEELAVAKAKFHQEVSKAEVAIGKGLVPALTSMIKTGETALGWVNKFIEAWQKADEFLDKWGKRLHIVEDDHKELATAVGESTERVSSSTETMAGSVSKSYDSIQGSSAKTGESTKLVIDNFSKMAAESGGYSQAMAEQFAKGQASLDDMASAAKYDHIVEDKLKAMASGNRDQLERMDADTNKAMDAMEASYNSNYDKVLDDNVKFFQKYHAQEEEGQEEIKKLQGEALPAWVEFWGKSFDNVLDKAGAFASKIKDILATAMDAVASIATLNIPLPSFHTGTPSVNRAGFYQVQKDETIFLPMGAGVQRAGMGPQPGGGASQAPSVTISMPISIDASNAGSPREVASMTGDVMRSEIASLIRNLPAALAARGVVTQGAT